MNRENRKVVQGRICSALNKSPSGYRTQYVEHRYSIFFFQRTYNFILIFGFVTSFFLITGVTWILIRSNKPRVLVSRSHRNGNYFFSAFLKGICWYMNVSMCFDFCIGIRERNKTLPFTYELISFSCPLGSSISSCSATSRRKKLLLRLYSLCQVIFRL